MKKKVDQEYLFIFKYILIITIYKLSTWIHQ